MEGTTARVRRERQFRVGVIASGGEDARIGRYLARVEQAAGASAVMRQGAAEPLLLELEQGELDLVVGEMERRSHWAKRVSLLPALAGRDIGTATAELVPIARNGENRWITLLDAEARKGATP